MVSAKGGAKGKAKGGAKGKVAGLSPRPGILDIEPYVGGRSTVSASPGGKVIKLSSNESPFGASPLADAAYRDSAARLHRYPDGGASGLRAALGELHGLDPERIVCGNGSDELISLLAGAYAGPGDEVLCSEYGFLVYPIAARSAGALPVTAAEPELRTDVDNLLAAATPRTRVVFIANPNNPTGSYVSAAELRRLREGLPGDALLVIDAAYAEYVGAADYSPGVELVDDFDNVVMTRTFSKIYGLAGLRLGWAYCPPAVADVLNRVRGPFNISAPALAAGEAALADVSHVANGRRHNDRRLPQLSADLARFGLTVYPSVANFILVRFPRKRNAAAANAFLLDHGIIPRTMEAYNLPDCLRISIGLSAEVASVVVTLSRFMR